MITVFGEGRGFRVVWLLEEMSLPYRLRDVDLHAGVADDAEFLRINPAGFIPALLDGDVTMVESIAIMEYLMARYGPTPLAPGASDARFPAYQQFLHLGEAGLAASIYFVSGARQIAPPAERDNWSARQAMDVFTTHLTLVSLQLKRAPYMAGQFHRSGHFRGLCAGTRAEECGRRAWRSRAGLCRAAAPASGVSAGAGHVPRNPHVVGELKSLRGQSARL
jgi:glutathione S-transferase